MFSPQWSFSWASQTLFRPVSESRANQKNFGPVSEEGVTGRGGPSLGPSLLANRMEKSLTGPVSVQTEFMPTLDSNLSNVTSESIILSFRPNGLR